MHQLITVSVQSALRMWRDGSDKPTIAIDLWSVGVFDVDRNPKYTADIFAYLKARLDIPADRYT